MLYIPTNFGENPFKEEQTLNLAPARTGALAHARLHTRVHAVLEHDKYVLHVTCGHL
jgi:hypothetical protein